METTDSSRRNRLQVTVAGAAMALLAFAYVLYASKAWFHQDDFGFIVKYSDRLRMSELVSLDGLGRFVTQNVYWHFGLDVLGRNAELFFFVNAMTVVAASVLVHRLARMVLDPMGALVAAFLYFASPRVVHAYAWISNSQHLVAHLMCLGFLVVLLRGRESSIPFARSVVLLGLLALAVLSNSFSVALLAPIVWQLAEQRHRSSNPYRLLVAGSAAIGVYAFVRSRNYAEGPYEVDLSFDVLMENARAYFESTTWFVLWFVGSAVVAVVLARRGRMVESTMFVCSIAFFVPFAFLVHQRYPQYGVMSLLFFLLGCWMVAHRLIANRLRPAVVAVSVVVTIVVSVYGMREFAARLTDPLGVRARHLVEDLRSDLRFEDPSISKLCFDHDPVLDAQGEETTLPPGVWWWVGHGKAFSLFVDGSKSYELLNDARDCDRIFFISPDGVHGSG